MGPKRAPPVWESAEHELRVIRSGKCYHLKGSDASGAPIDHRLPSDVSVDHICTRVTVSRGEAEELLAAVERHRSGALVFALDLDCAAVLTMPSHSVPAAHRWCVPVLSRAGPTNTTSASEAPAPAEASHPSAGECGARFALRCTRMVRLVGMHALASDSNVRFPWQALLSRRIRVLLMPVLVVRILVTSFRIGAVSPGRLDQKGQMRVLACQPPRHPRSLLHSMVHTGSVLLM